MSQGTLLVWIENCKMYRKDWMEWISFMFFMDAIMMTLLLATDFVNRTCQKVGTWKILGNLVSHFLMHQFNLCNESKQDFFLQSLRLMISFGDVIWYSKAVSLVHFIKLLTEWFYHELCRIWQSCLLKKIYYLLFIKALCVSNVKRVFILQITLKAKVRTKHLFRGN